MLGLFLKEEVFFYTKSYLLEFSMLATHQESIWIPVIIPTKNQSRAQLNRYILNFHVMDLNSEIFCGPEFQLITT